MVTLTVTEAGLIARPTFASDDGFTAETGFTREDATGYVVHPIARILLDHGASGDADYTGAREGQGLLDAANRLWLVYDGSRGDDPWRQHVASSSNLGMSTTKHGPQSIGLSDGNGGTYPAVATGFPFLDADGVFHLHRVISLVNYSGGVNEGLPMGPYIGDEWRASAMLGEWTLEQSYGPTSWASSDLLPGSVVQDYGSPPSFCMFVEAGNGLSYKVALQRSSLPGGPWVLDGSALFGSEKIEGPRNPENGKAFRDPNFGGFGLLINCIAPDGTHTDRNAFMHSDAVDDWSGSEVLFTQSKYHPDTCYGALAVGCASHITGPGGALVYDAVTGDIPLIYDASGSDTVESPGFHIHRVLRLAIAAPFAKRVAYSNLTSTPHRYYADIAHTDVDLQFACLIASVGSGAAYWAIEVRGYRLQIRAQSGANWLHFEKQDGTTVQDGTVTSAGVELNVLLRGRLKIIGTKIDAWLCGEHQIDVTNSASSSGTRISIVGCNITGWFADLPVRNGKTLTLRGFPASSTIGIRAACGMPIGQVDTDEDGVATYDSEAPIAMIEYAPGRYARPTGGRLNPGDDATLAGYTPRLPGSTANGMPVFG